MENREIAHLCAEDIDRGAGIIRIRAGANGEERSVPLSTEILEALDALPLPRRGPAFVRYRTGAPVDAGTVNHSVSHFLRQLGIAGTLRDAVSPEELETAITAARDEPPPPFAGWPGHRQRLLCYLLLATYAGTRAQEIAGLCVEDIDRMNGMLRIRAGKGDKERNVPLHPELLAALDDLPLPEAGPAFVCYGTGAQVRPHNVSAVVNQFFKRLGISATLHQLRHWFATNVYRANADLRLTQELLGHASPAVTAVYAAFDPGRSAPTVNALSAS
jgi:integrase